MTDLATALEARLVRYVQFSTQSDEASTTVPSTANQLELLKALSDIDQSPGAKELQAATEELAAKGYNVQ